MIEDEPRRAMIEPRLRKKRPWERRQIAATSPVFHIRRLVFIWARRREIVAILTYESEVRPALPN